ncbi:MAG TPA: biotin synthase BioB [Rhabdochlamydiaceae bacterium]|jgi:biotin synthase
MNSIRYDWTLEEMKELYDLALIDLIAKSHALHCQYHRVGEVQVCTLISIKTGGCPEDCKYCAQSSRYQTPIAAQPMMSYEEVLKAAQKGVESGATRICLGAAWRQVRDGKQFEEVLRMIQGIAALGVEVCCTLGMLQEHQAKRLKEAGLYAYNHNLDSSETFYKAFVTTRSYQDRLDTLDIVEVAHLSICCGGILGMGEKITDRLELLLKLATRHPHPGSVPINQLTQIPGTPFEDQPKLSFWEVLRIIAIARITMPQAMVRLSCGRVHMSYEEQLLCFFTGANSIFAGEKLLTVANPSLDKDTEMFALFGLKKQRAFNK